MFVAQGRGGFRVYDIASIANKGFSERIVSAPVSPLGQDTHVASRNATCMALPTNQPIRPDRNEAMATTPLTRPTAAPSPCSRKIRSSASTRSTIMRWSPIPRRACILVNVNTLADGDARNNHLSRAVTWNENGVLPAPATSRWPAITPISPPPPAWSWSTSNDPLHPRHVVTIPLTDARASALQFRYLWVTDAEGLKLFDVTSLEAPRAGALGDGAARRRAPRLSRPDLCLCRRRPRRPGHRQHHPSGAAGRALAILAAFWTGRTPDTQDVTVASTNASLFAYVADGRNGMKVLQLISPESQPNFYGFSPRPVPELIAWARTPSAALSVAKGLDRDRAVDETGGQIAVFGRLGSRPFTRSEMERLYLNSRRLPYRVSDSGTMEDWVGPPLQSARPNRATQPQIGWMAVQDETSSNHVGADGRSRANWRCRAG